MDALEKVKQAEVERERLIEEAKSSAHGRYREAGLAAEKRIQEARTEVEKQADEMLDGERVKIKEEIKKLTLQYEKDRKELKRHASKNKERTVKLIKDKII